jgi:hypothetical protein
MRLTQTPGHPEVRLFVVGLTLATVSSFLVSCGASRTDPLEGVRPSLDGIRATEIARHMGVLADDAMEGRFTGTEGYRRAAEYVAERFEELGLEPAGDDGSFFQTVPLRQSELRTEDSSIELTGIGEAQALRPYVDYYLAPNMLQEEIPLVAQTVFVGFGVTAPELDYDDYEGIDVRGKIVVVFGGAPSFFPNDERAYYSSGRVKRKNLRERGAVGALWMRTPEMEERYPFEKSIQNARIPSMRWIDNAGGVQDAHPEYRLSGRLGPEGAKKLFRGGRIPIEQVRAAVAEDRPEPFELPVTLSAHTASRHSAIESSNVVAILPGSDPELKNEYVVLSAHLDHLGVGEPVDGDSIRNGAYDNASGIAIMLEVARAAVRLSEPPPRSLLFLAVTGEERGLLGSDYFVHHPSVPLDDMVADINLDMVLMLHPLRDVVAFGAEHSTLLHPLEQAAHTLGLSVAPDPYPEEVIFVRSDQYSFVRKGIPSVFLVAGIDSGDPAVDGKALEMNWFENIYHTPQDDLTQEFDFEAGVDFTRLNFLMTCLVAGAPERPAWNEGDFFGERFAGEDAE